MFKFQATVLFLLFCFVQSSQAQKNVSTTSGELNRRVDSLLRLMTLEEKVGQLNQYTSDWNFTGPITPDNDKIGQIRAGKVGSMLNVKGVEHTRILQSHALQSRLKIPLLFGQDVVHGFRTTFPLPLAEAASWDIEAIELSARIAATEAAAAGVHWTFAPMVDIYRDPRWGRVMEGAGEDSYLGARIAAARVRGFQGKQLGDLDAVMACAKHFAAYGAAEGGRDYNSVDMSLRKLWEVYMPPFKAAADAGAATFMNSFNDLNGIPATGSSYLQREVLKGKWGFKGFVVSDWGSIGEMVNHGFAVNDKEAALLAINAGSDMDMESRSYRNHLVALVKEGKVKEDYIDDAVRRILQKKFELGLFEDPYRFSVLGRQAEQWNKKENLIAAREMAKKSIVLLKNENAALPLSKSKKLALIGPFVKSVRDNLGFWSIEWPDDSLRIVNLWQGVKDKMPKGSVIGYARGCNVNDNDTSGFAEAISVAQNADVIILTVGEASDMSGEAKSRSNLHLPGVQQRLIQLLAGTGKPIILLVHAGRPLVIQDAVAQSSAVLYTWWLGTEAGHAIADVLFGEYNPSGRLPMTFPRTEGQIPIYYNHYNTGRPAAHDNHSNYVSAYIDLPNSPAYPFGFGLSYTQFDYGKMTLSDTLLNSAQKLKMSVTITNRGKYAGKETVQLYTRDIAASVVRPVKELKGFQQVFLQPGESKTIVFEIATDDLRFYNEQLEYIWEPGDFDIMIGRNALDVERRRIRFIK